MKVHAQHNGYVIKTKSGFLAVLTPTIRGMETREEPFDTSEDAIAFLNRN